VWALVAFVGWVRSHRATLARRGGGPLFALAFMTKVTSVFGCMAAVIVCSSTAGGATRFVCRRSRPRPRSRFVATAQLASDGRFVESILATGGARGSVDYFLTAPLFFFNQVTEFDRPFMLTLPAAVGLAVVGRRVWLRQPAAVGAGGHHGGRGVRHPRQPRPRRATT
jgi:hypothetical protein